MIFFRNSGSTMRYLMAKKVLACALALLVAAPLERVATAQQPRQSSAGSSSLPESQQPSTDQNAAPNAAPDMPASQPGQDQQPAAPAPALGTAAAPYEKTSGITGTRPAGAVIAPARQRRIRSVLIKVAIVAGAGAAIAAVALLSHASPSQPH